MNERSIGVVDYEMGNLHSVAKALATTGSRVFVSNQTSKLKAADILVLPGVGSFGAAMRNLSKKKLDGFVQNWIIDDRPFLGICLGLQLLFERSEESPRVRGLGVFKGDVVRFRSADFKRKKLQIPHMGWNNATPAQSNTLGINDSDYFYFVHSYFPEPEYKKDVFTVTNYGRPFCSAVSRGNLVATQYHPEKSGDMGLKLLKNFVRARKS